MYGNTSMNFIMSEYLSQTWVRPILLYVNPVLTVFGFLGNAFSFVAIVYHKLYSKTPIFVFFMYMSVADFLYVVTDCLYVNEYLLGFRLCSRYELACQIVPWVAHTAMAGSSWILVTATAYRLYGLARPLHMRKHDGKRASHIACCVILGVWFAVYSCTFSVHGIFKQDISRNVSLTLCFMPDPNAASLYGAALMVVYSIGPGSILTVLSVGIYAVFARSYLQHKLLLKGNANAETDAEASNTFKLAKNSVAMLVPLSLIHILCTIPMLLYISIRGALHSPEFFFVTDRLWLVNHTMNVYVQLIVSRFYREAMLPRLFKST